MSQDLPPARATFGIRFALLARRWRRQLDTHLSDIGLTDATWVPMVHLRETGGGLTQKDLAARVGVDGSSLVRVLDILERDGLIERQIDAEDRRARRLFLTPKGDSRVAGILQELAKTEEDMLSDLSEADLAGMLGHFAIIDQRLNAIESARQSQHASEKARRKRGPHTMEAK